MRIHRENTHRIFVGDVPIGNGAPVSIQSMTNTKTVDVVSTVNQIHKLEHAGCDIVRVSIPDRDSLEALPRIKEQSRIPIIADIHFDHKLAVGSIKSGADGIRINPGNIGSAQKVKEIVMAAIDCERSVRIGVNLGSLKKRTLEKYASDRVGAIVESAREYVSMVEDMGLKSIKVSLKSSDVIETIESYRRFAQISNWPLHLGVTEAGTLLPGLIRSSVGMGVVLNEGIGDTLRVSLSADPVQEVLAGRILLECLGLRKEGVRVIACPMCARSNADVAAIAMSVEEATRDIKKHMVVAVMGCAVNGPGEARLADIGVACDKQGAVLFKGGKTLRHIARDKIAAALVNEIEKETHK